MQLHQAADVVVGERHADPAGRTHGLGEGGRRRGQERRGRGLFGAGHHPPLAVDQIDRVHVADHRLAGQEGAELQARALEAGLVAHEVLGHGAHPVANELLLLLDIGARDGGGVVDHGAHAVGEPGLHPLVDQQAEEHRHDHRGRHRRQGEGDDETAVQPHAGVARPGSEQADHPVGGETGQADDHAQVGRQHRQDGAAGRGQRPAGRRAHGQEHRRGRDQGGEGEDHPKRIGALRPHRRFKRGAAIEAVSYFRRDRFGHPYRLVACATFSTACCADAPPWTSRPSRSKSAPCNSRP